MLDNQTIIIKTLIFNKYTFITKVHQSQEKRIRLVIKLYNINNQIYEGYYQ